MKPPKPSSESPITADTSSTPAQPRRNPGIQIVTGYRLALLGLAALSGIIGLVFARLPEKAQYALVAVFPALLAGGYAIVNPFAGVWMFVLMDYLRPYTFIPALRPLRLGILTVAVTLAAWVIHRAINKGRVYYHPFMLWLLAYFLIITSSVLTSANNFYAYRVFEGFLVTSIMFFLVVNLVTTRERLNSIIWLLLLIHFYYALKGIYNFVFVGAVYAGQVTSGSVGSSFISDENDFALALNSLIPLAFFMFQNQTSRFKKYLLLAVLVSFFLGVVSSQSRGGWIGLMAVVIFCILKSKRKLASFAVMAAMALLVAIFAPSSYWNEIKSITDTSEATANSRLNYWKAAFGMFLDHPVTGVGAGNGPIHMPYYVSGVRDPATQWGRTFHGTLPLVLAETGALGMLCYLMMLFVSFKTLIRVQKRYTHDHQSNQWTFASGLAGGMMGWIITATFLSAAYYPHLWTLHALTVVLALTIETDDREVDTNPV